MENPYAFFICKILLLVGSAYRANTCASAALDACTSVDNVLAIALGDSANGALTSASAAAYTRTIDYICHVKITSLNLYNYNITVF